MARSSSIKPEDLIPYAASMCTQAETASILGVHRRTIENLLQKPAYRRAWETARNSTRMKLRQAQLTSAISKGDRAALIWLGKQYLDQRDSPREIEQNVNVEVRYVAEWGGGSLEAAAEAALEGEVEEILEDEEE